MKRFYFLPKSLFLLFLNLCSFGISAQTETKGLCSKTEMLPASTVILLENSEKVSSDGTVGQVVAFRVHGNVTVNGNVLIRDGAGAIGRIKRVQEAGRNFPAQLVLLVTHVRTADDQMIAVAGDETTFNGRYTLQGFTVEQGQRFTATVMNNTVVGIK